MKQNKNVFFLRPEDVELMKKYNEEFEGESPRATVIIGHAYSHEMLRELLKKRLVEDKDLFKKISKLGFVECMDLCYLTGLISKLEKDDLEKINFIRNRFAHKIFINNFENKEVSNKCNELHIIAAARGMAMPDIFPFNTPKEKFTTAVSLYMFILNIRLGEYKRLDERRPYKD